MIGQKVPSKISQVGDREVQLLHYYKESKTRSEYYLVTDVTLPPKVPTDFDWDVSYQGISGETA